MSNIAIKAENISKAYQLGEFSTGTVTNDIERWFAKLRGKEDPFLKIGETNDRTSIGKSNMVWSLKNINFDIKRGDAVGIIGRNGAGKSTLLKVLSRVTAPTTGNIRVKGRIASLLEVGTGFHPELTGRENIFLNGAILGMRKQEIKRKFDEIVDFAGVERYIDTPVKRYSSGMYVRLAFAVAAHLESEILIVDEVLAVGDAEFQKKCLGKMSDVSKGQGRTILFVSHNMGAVKNLCNQVVVIANGEINFIGDTKLGIDKYINNSESNNETFYLNDKIDKTHIVELELLNEKNDRVSDFKFDENIFIRCCLQVKEVHISSRISMRVVDNLDRNIFTSELEVKDFMNKGNEFLALQLKIPSNILVPNSYKIQFALHIPNVELIELLPEILNFTIIESGSEFYMYHNTDYGCVFINCEWQKLN